MALRAILCAWRRYLAARRGSRLPESLCRALICRKAHHKPGLYTTLAFAIMRAWRAAVKVRGFAGLKLSSVFQSLSSIGVVLLLAYTERWQEANWPEGRVVWVHPWLLFLAWAMLICVLIMGIAGSRDSGPAARLNQILPQASSALLAAAVLMALFMPGPYAP